MTGALPLVIPPPFEKGGRKLFVYYFFANSTGCKLSRRLKAGQLVFFGVGYNL